MKKEINYGIRLIGKENVNNIYHEIGEAEHKEE